MLREADNDDKQHPVGFGDWTFTAYRLSPNISASASLHAVALTLSHRRPIPIKFATLLRLQKVVGTATGDGRQGCVEEGEEARRGVPWERTRTRMDMEDDELITREQYGHLS